MATSQFIPPFPEDQDRDSFGAWLAGFTAAEGCFHLRWMNVKSRSGVCRVGVAQFMILLRWDDQEILEKIRSFLQCGMVYSQPPPSTRPDANPTSRYVVASAKDLNNLIVPNFKQYPMGDFSKKQKDFVIWREAVAMLHEITRRKRSSHQGTKWTDGDRSRFDGFLMALKNQRRFNALEADLSLLRKPGKDILDQPLLGFDD